MSLYTEIQMACVKKNVETAKKKTEEKVCKHDWYDPTVEDVFGNKRRGADNYLPERVCKKCGKELVFNCNTREFYDPEEEKTNSKKTNRKI